MEVIKLNEAEIGQNKEKCKTLEYSFGDKDIDLGIATIGRLIIVKFLWFAHQLGVLRNIKLLKNKNH